MEVKLITLEKLKETIAKSSTAELGYLLGVYGGPNKVLLREKVYTHEAARALTDLVAHEIASREMDALLTGTLLS